MSHYQERGRAATKSCRRGWAPPTSGRQTLAAHPFRAAAPCKGNCSCGRTVSRASSAQASLWGYVCRSPPRLTRVSQGHLPGLLMRPKMQYTIDLLPPQAAGFVPKMRTNDALVTQGIIVTTAGTPGVKIPSHAPPGYAYPEEADYTRSLGYLENGNQR